jgi:hypothetical protein
LHRRKVGRQNVAPEGGVSLSKAVTTYLFPCFNFSADSETAISQLGAGLARLRHHERTCFDLLEYPFRLLALTRSDFPEFIGHRNRDAAYLCGRMESRLSMFQAKAHDVREG